jgi:hypothetical protein
MTDQFHLDLKGCVKNKGVLCIPLPELIRLFEKFPYHMGKQFSDLLKQANVSDKIQEVEKE